MVTTADLNIKIVHALFLPARFQSGCPLGIGLAVVAHVDGRRGALKYVQLFGPFPQMRNTLHASGAGTDDANTLIFEIDQIAVGVTAGVRVIPAAGVKGVTCIVVDAGDAR